MNTRKGRSIHVKKIVKVFVLYVNIMKAIDKKTLECADNIQNILRIKKEDAKDAVKI